MATDRKQLSVTIRADLIDRLEAEADARIVSKALIVEKAVDAYLDALAPVEATLAAQSAVDASKLPGPPAGEKRAARDMGDVENPEGT